MSKSSFSAECPPGQILSECMCWKSCEVMAANETCYDPGSPSCRVGCQCPHGQVMHEGHCQPDTKCPCIYDGKFYAVRVNGIVPILNEKIHLNSINKLAKI